MDRQISAKCCGITKKGFPCNRKVLIKKGNFCFSHIKNKLGSIGEVNQKKSFFKPFLKWVGGKQSSLASLIPQIPNKINSYYEFFLGGGSVLLFVLHLQSSSRISVKNIHVSDLNSDLINVYLVIKHKWAELYTHLNHFSINYMGLSSLELKKEYYINIRDRFNFNIKNGGYNKIEHAAMFIFLNKTCFRGMFRLNKKGEFNVSFGNYVTPKILIEKSHLEFLSSLFKNVNFYSMGYNEAFKKVKPGDFIYLDPPYFPEKKNSFVSYNSEGFPLSDHTRLFSLIKLVSIKTSFLLSNSNTEFVLNFFKEFFITKTIVKTRMNWKNPGKNKTELLIGNINPKSNFL